MHLRITNKIVLQNEGDGHYITFREEDGTIYIQTGTPDSKHLKFSIDKDEARELGEWLTKNSESK